jgi:hypothetical protein
MLSGEDGKVHPQPRCWRCFQIVARLRLGSISCLLVCGRVLLAERSAFLHCPCRHADGSYICRSSWWWLCTHASCIVFELAHPGMRVVLWSVQ